MTVDSCSRAEEAYDKARDALHEAETASRDANDAYSKAQGVDRELDRIRDLIRTALWECETYAQFVERVRYDL